LWQWEALPTTSLRISFRLEVVQEPLSLGRVDSSAFKKWDPTQLVVEESEIAFARIKLECLVRKTRKQFFFTVP
jgi:hypothetical protein